MINTCLSSTFHSLINSCCYIHWSGIDHISFKIHHKHQIPILILNLKQQNWEQFVDLILTSLQTVEGDYLNLRNSCQCGHTLTWDFLMYSWDTGSSHDLPNTLFTKLMVLAVFLMLPCLAATPTVWKLFVNRHHPLITKINVLTIHFGLKFLKILDLHISTNQSLNNHWVLCDRVLINKRLMKTF